MKNRIVILATIFSMLMFSEVNAYEGNKENELGYDKVFKQNSVIRIDIEIDKDDWLAMNSELDSIIGPIGNHGRGGPRSGGDRPEGDRPEGMRPPRSEQDSTMNEGRERRERPEGPPPPMGGDGVEKADPSWIECKVKYNGESWSHTGIRVKGNSSLSSAYQSDSKKFSFKLDFDQFEDQYPEIKNQRFYGFKQLNLNNNCNDATLMRETIASDLFRQFGLASANTTFCVLYVDYGSGSVPFGIYTLIEEVDDSVIKSQFKDGGNLYKPENRSATFADGTFNKEDMGLKTNKKKGNYSDIESLYSCINSDLRTSDIEAWKQDLEEIFDVDIFLRWLAVNSTIQNWDTYGAMNHNYLLYNNPDTNLLTWVPWDNNESLQEPKRGRNVDVGFDGVDSSWPLIRYILDCPEYKNRYNSYIDQFTSELFTSDNMHKIYDQYYTLLSPYVDLEVEKGFYLKTADQFESEVTRLKEHVLLRKEKVDSYLEKI